MLRMQRISLAIEQISPSSEYFPLILPEVIPLFKLPDPDEYWVAIEARVGDELIGLSLSLISKYNHTARLYSLVIKPSFRQQGFGTELFCFTQQLLADEEKIRSLDLEFEESDPYTPIVEKILASQEWTPARVYLIRCYFDVYKFNAPWIHHPYKLPTSMKFFNWKKLTLSEKKSIEHMYEQGKFLPYLSPLIHKEMIDLKTSVGLRDHGELIGWSITYRLDPSTLRYAILYIDNDYIHSGYGIQLVIESIRRHKQFPTPTAVFEVNFQEIDPSWWRFVKKRLIPIADKIERFKRTTRLFI